MGHATHRERYGSLLNVLLPPQLGSVSRAKGRERGSERNEMDGGGAAIPDDTRRLLGGNLRTPRTYLRFVDSSGYVVMMSSEGRALHRSYFCLFSKYKNANSLTYVQIIRDRNTNGCDRPHVYLHFVITHLAV